MIKHVLKQHISSTVGIGVLGLIAIIIIVISSINIDVPENDFIVPQLQKINEDPTLPRVLLLGDSISIWYTFPVRNLLRGHVNVIHISENGGSTRYALSRIDEWLGSEQWDVIYFNFGLHDVRLADGNHEVPLDEYSVNLDTLVRKLESTGAHLIWATITPVPEGDVYTPRLSRDVIEYNAVALTIMRQKGIEVSDLYAYAFPRLALIQLPKDVHFTTEGCAGLAIEVAESIRSALAQ